MTEGKLIRIDLRQVLASRLGGRMRYVPDFMIKRLEKLIHQDELNELLEHNFPRRGAAFCDGVLADLGVGLDVRHAERLPESGRAIFVSNHPLGGLDGIAMISWLTHRYEQEAKFVVNDLLMAIDPLTDCFLPVNKHGSQNRGSVRLLDEALAGTAPVVIYPAGLVSRRGADGTVADLQWHKMFVNKAIEYRRDVVPVHFDGLNSRRFYRLASLRSKSGIKFNYEMVLLPGEVFGCRGRRFTLTCGHPIPWERLQGGHDAEATAEAVRRKVYELATTTVQ